MSAEVSTLDGRSQPVRADVALRHDRMIRASATTWVITALAGQAFFGAYVMAFYGGAAWRGQWQGWNQVLAYGFKPGDTLLNVVLGIHLLFAVMILVGGALQLSPGVRRHAPAVHRWNGRLYLLLAAALALGGLARVWLRGAVGDLTQHVAITVNALLILLMAWSAWRAIRRGRMDVHRRWALRLFLVVSGVWFFRIGLSLWLVLNQGPAGFNPDTFSGPFLTFLSLAQYVLPLLVLEAYFWVQRQRARRGSQLMTAVLACCTLLTAAGSAAAAMVLWLPRF